MLVNLIPYFLTANLAVNETAWEKGPQIFYFMSANVAATEEYHQFLTTVTNVTSHLLCQPKSPDTLRCQFTTMNGTGYIVNPAYKSEDSSKHARLFDIKMDDFPFEVKFNSEGIEHLAVPGDKSEYDERLRVIKAVASLLNIDSDIVNKPDGQFQKSEKFIVGECSANYNVKRVPLDEVAKEDVDFELRPVSTPDKAFEQGLDWTVQRDLENCKSLMLYLNMSDSTSPDRLRQMEFTLNSVDEHFTITDKGFQSESKMDFFIERRTSERKIDLKTDIVLRLESIKPAEEKFPEIEDSKITSVRFY